MQSYVHLLLLIFFSYTFGAPSRNFDITIQVPENLSFILQQSYKSIHVKYVMPTDNYRWKIVGFDSFDGKSNGTIEQMTVHLCDATRNIRAQNYTWFNDESFCQNVRSMLIYQWTPYLSSSRFQLPEEQGFRFDPSFVLVFSVVYTKERISSPDRSGVIIYLSDRNIRFSMGSIVVGNKRRDIRFSCRSSFSTRVLYGVKRLWPNSDAAWWRIYVVRVRQFGRKFIQTVQDTTINGSRNTTDLKLISSELFLLSGDYLILECEPSVHTSCEFLIYYLYRNNEYSLLKKSDDQCDQNNYPSLFELIPLKTQPESDMKPSFFSTLDGTTIFWSMCAALVGIWISIIVTCVILRHIRGQVNFRTEPSSPFSNQKTKPQCPAQRRNQHAHMKALHEAENVAHQDPEHLGLMH